MKEAIRSHTAKKYGIDNSPTSEHLLNLKKVAENIFQKVRDHFGVPIFVSSGYRSYALNSHPAVNGSKTSAHTKGQALDLDADVFEKITNADIFHYIHNNLDYDQLIWEFGDEEEPDWVHVAYVEGKNRGQTLVAKRNSEGKTYYKKYMT